VSFVLKAGRLYSFYFFEKETFQNVLMMQNKNNGTSILMHFEQQDYHFPRQNHMDSRQQNICGRAV
jgi:hypothetical protein